jgi:hypothetical protein
MNISKSRFNILSKRVLSVFCILSLFCCLFLGFDLNIIKAETFTQAGAIPPKTPSPVITNNGSEKQTWEQATSLYPNSPVLTPTGGAAMMSQTGPQVDATCGISSLGGKWNYCMLAPVNGFISGTPLSNGKEIVNLGVPNPLPTFFGKIYNIAIATAIALAIITISLGGIRLATTDSISGTDEGKKMVNAALAGLFLALFSYVLLYTINPSLVENGSGTIFPNTDIPIKSTPGITPATDNSSWRQQATDFEKK